MLTFIALICTTIFSLIYLPLTYAFPPLNLIKIVVSFCNLQIMSTAKITRFPDENSNSVSRYVKHVWYKILGVSFRGEKNKHSL